MPKQLKNELLVRKDAREAFAEPIDVHEDVSKNAGVVFLTRLPSFPVTRMRGSCLRGFVEA